MAEERKLTVKGVRVNNLKNIDLTIPRDKFVVFTGLSGSGKSSLAFDTIYAEGHRRFVESLSSYARMFLGQLDKPDIDSIEGLSPSISIDQKTTSKNPRSTVGTVTEIYDYLRLLYARVGIPHCPICGKEIRQQTVDQILDSIMAFEAGTRFMVLSPVVRAKKGMHEKVLDTARKNGYVRVRVDGYIYDLGEEITLEKNNKHNIDIVVDRLVMRDDIRTRLSDSVENALELANGNLTVTILGREGEKDRDLTYSINYACEEHNISIGEMAPTMFSFNNPAGACPECAGLGEMRTMSADKLIPDKSLSLRGGAIMCNGFKTLEEESWNGPLFDAVGQKYGFTLDTPIKDYSPKAYDVFIHGDGQIYEVRRYFGGVPRFNAVRFEGLLKMVQQRYDMTQADYYEQFIENTLCPKCGGKRLKAESLAVTVGGKNIHELCSLSVTKALEFVNGLTFTEMEYSIAKEIVKEVRSRLGFLENVGLDYLTLTRKAGTLSGGEAQRIRLATQIGSNLMGVMYVLDEPSIGLHQRDNSKLINTLKKFRDAGNSLIVVEHDEETMLESDYIVDIGPGAGIHGGQIVAQGTPSEIMKNKNSVTGDYLSGRKK